MVKLLKPKKLDLEPNETNAANEWKHWRVTFENFIDAAQSVMEGRTLDKLKTLVNSVSYNVYEYFEECETYDNAIEVLQRLYVKTPNEIFARHRLATQQQTPEQSLDAFIITLRKLSKDCNFKPVSAVQYREEMIRDAFINGLQSNVIRQRLLERKDLTLETAFDIARSLEEAQKKAEFYEAPMLSSALITPDASELDAHNEVRQTVDVLAAANTGKLCFFCGYLYHERKFCPARDKTCNKCHTKGHFAKACRKIKAVKVTSASVFTPSLCVVQSVSECLSPATISSYINGQHLSTFVDSGIHKVIHTLRRSRF